MRNKSIEPFRLLHHTDSWSLLLEMDDDAQKLFSVNPDELELEEDFELDGYYWDALVKCYLDTGQVAMTDEVHFDSESSMFCIYSLNESDLRLFAQSFKEACANPLCLEEMLRGFGEYLD